MAHTQGPWFYDSRTNCIGTPAGWLATMADQERESDTPFGNKNADARLIAAAPDLLTIVEGMLMYPDVKKHIAAKFPGLIKQAEAALAKAVQVPAQ